MPKRQTTLLDLAHNAVRNGRQVKTAIRPGSLSMMSPSIRQDILLVRMSIQSLKGVLNEPPQARRGDMLSLRPVLQGQIVGRTPWLRAGLFSAL